MSSHTHPRPSSTAERRALHRALALTAVILVAEVAGGIVANSLALLSDAGHMLTDLLALALSATAIGLATRPATLRRTFGYYRVEILSALANGILLAVFAGGILVEALNRFGNPPLVRVGVLAPIAAAGLVANALSLWWLSRAQGGLPTRAALWHTASDAATSVAVLAGGGVMALTGAWWLDPALSVLLAGVMVFGALRLLRDSVDVLLESTPRGVDLGRVGDAIRGIPGVESVHDLHVWSLTSAVHALSGHLRVHPDQLGDADRILAEARGVLARRFGIGHATLQVESERCGEIVCVLRPGDAPPEALIATAGGLASGSPRATAPPPPDPRSRD
jgi:cobalt-zinc-cadmium efflux system protein